MKIYTITADTTEGITTEAFTEEHKQIETVRGWISERWESHLGEMPDNVDDAYNTLNEAYCEDYLYWETHEMGEPALSERKLYVLFGEQAIVYYENEKPKSQVLIEGEYKELTFNTEAELYAYKQGIGDAEGWGNILYSKNGIFTRDCDKNNEVTK